MAKRILGNPMTRAEMIREASKVLITTSWRMKLNANGCDDFDAQAIKKDLPVQTYVAGVGVDLANNRLYIYAEEPGVDGTVPITRGESIRTYSFSAARTFVNVPELQFDIRREYPLMPGKDDEGLDCLVIPLNNFTERPVRSAKSKK